MPKVFNKYHKNAPADAIYIGRGSPWGNPYPISPTCTREQCLEKYQEHLAVNPELVALAREQLKGKNLVCFCAPAKCHGDILLALANS